MKFLGRRRKSVETRHSAPPPELVELDNMRTTLLLKQDAELVDLRDRRALAVRMIDEYLTRGDDWLDPSAALALIDVRGVLSPQGRL